MEPVDRKNVKEIVGADRAVTKMLCHYFVSVNTGEGFFCLFSFFFFDRNVGRQDYRSADKMKNVRLSDQEVFAQEFKRVWHGRSLWRANRSPLL